MLKSLSNWSRNVQCWGQQKFFKKGVWDAEKRKSNRRVLGKYFLLPGAREELQKQANLASF